MTLTEFVAARLDEDEAAARAAPDVAQEVHDLRFAIKTGERADLFLITRDLDDIETHAGDAIRDPARALREVAAGRAILAAHRQWVFGGVTGCSTCHAGHEVGDPSPGPCPTLRALAAVYSDHPDYDPAWAPPG